MNLSPDEQAMLALIDGKDEQSRRVVFLPERKSPDMTSELWEKRAVLKSLVYKGLIRIDVDFNNRCLVFYTAKSGSLGTSLYMADSILDREYL